MPRLFFTVVFLLITASYSLARAAAADSVEVLTLDRAIAESLQNNRLIKISNQSVLYANDEIRAARTQRYYPGTVPASHSWRTLVAAVVFTRKLAGSELPPSSLFCWFPCCIQYLCST
jgi:hypothetical protein